jgi:hypothetical protein
LKVIRLPMFLLRVIIFAAVLLLSGCGTGSREPSQGEALVGPTTLALWTDLAPRAPVSATVKQGDRVQILEVRRRFVRVRTAGGVEGWTEAEFLLNKAQVEAYQALQDNLAQMPSMGQATVYSPLNTHIAPHRVAPSFSQIPELGRVEIIGHAVAPRGVYQPRLLKKSRDKAVEEGARSDESSAKQGDAGVPPPPAPLPLMLPDNWLRMSRPRLSDIEGVTTDEEREQENEAAPVPSDDWYLIRTPEGRSSWVLARSLFMAVPDDVAQYAERARIMAYFVVGEVTDGEKTHKNWLWATLGAYNVPYQFDSFRYFTWNRRRHRYETSYIERRLHGYYPIQLVKSKTGAVLGFSLVVRATGGALEQRTYQIRENHVSLSAREPYAGPVNDFPGYLIPDVAPPPINRKDGGGFFQNLWMKARSLFRR